MAIDNNPLASFVGKSNFINFEEGGVEGIYKGVSQEEDPFTAGEIRLVYVIEIEGEEKKLSSRSKRLAKEFLKKNPKVGDFIRITRSGEGFKTDYELEVGKDGNPF